MPGLSPEPMICLTEAARQSAVAANVWDIGVDPAEYAKFQEVTGANLEVPGITIVFGGMQKRAHSPTIYDAEQEHLIIFGPNSGKLSVADAKFLPTLSPAEADLRKLIVCPIPTSWTSAELSASVARNLYKHPSVARLAVPTIAGGTVLGAGGGLLAMPFLHKAGYEVSSPDDVALGFGAIGALAGAGVTFAVQALRAGRFSQMQNRARQVTPFPMTNTWGGSL